MKIKADYVNAPLWKELTVRNRLPEELKCLDEIAHNLWWVWNYEARDLFRDLDPDLYHDVKHNPVMLLERLTFDRKEAIVKDDMPGAELVSLQVVTDMINQLVNGKLDALVLDGAVAVQYAQNNKELAIADASSELGEALPYCVAVAKGDPKGLLPEINAAIADMVANKKVEQFIADADALADVAVEVSAE
jgi:hypothetical protein